MKINRTIFRQYDVRGHVNVDLTEDFAYSLARGCAAYYKKELPSIKKVSIGHDARESSPLFASALIKGFNDSGLDTVFLGMVPTGLLYFSMFTLDVQASVMITGSHNPPEYNGFKINLVDLPVYGDGIQKIADIMEADDFIDAEVKGKNSEYNIIPDFEKYILKNIKIQNPEKLKIVVDSGNGVGGFVAVPILRKMGVNVISIFEEPDGTFPNHHPDPTVEKYIQDMIKTVIAEKADFGIGYDGDADRIGLVDRNGKIIWGDKILTIFSRSILEEVPGATIVAEVKCSKTLYDDIKKRGGKGIMWKAGHSLIKAKMKEVGAAFGGEMSGHVFFKHRFFGYDCAIYSTFRLLEIVSKMDHVDFDKLLEGIPETFSTPEIRLEVDDLKKFGIVENVVKYFKNEGADVNDIDGVRVTFDDGWGLMRPSNTQNVIVLRVEADSLKRMNEIRELLERKLDEYNR
ncbi:MAG TPA: phosphomannomutase/phosphoglucomutase [bacterium]|nr:phosphomannomutase/phosphoglucomutase [bacterium]HPM48155.1 phosphomannomutase/phosphoglucomutase [bacterium]